MVRILIMTDDFCELVWLESVDRIADEYSGCECIVMLNDICLQWRRERYDDSTRDVV